MVLRSEGQYVATVVIDSICSNKWYGVRHRNNSTSELLTCGDDRLYVATTRKISWPSVTKTSSEFIVDSKLDSNLVAIGFNPINDTLIEILLNSPVRPGDSIGLRFKNGSDNNIILSVCGKDVGNFADTLFYYLPLVHAQLNMSYSTNLLNASFDGSASFNADSLLWDFGDGSPLQVGDSLTHGYPAAGVYTVRAIAFKDCGVNDTLSFNLEVCELPVAAFQLKEVNDSLKVAAADSNFSYFWDLGDGNFGQGQEFSHRYASDSTYKVTLYAYNNCGDTVLSDSSFQFCLDPQARWTASIQTNSNGGATVKFDGRASRNYRSFLWLFGDGQSDNTSITPQHNYLFAAQAFKVSLILKNDCGEIDTNAYTLAEIGLIDRLALAGYSIYPNPATSKITLNLARENAEDTELRIINDKGQAVLVRKLTVEEPNRGELIIDISALPAGSYLLEIVEGKRTIGRERLIKL